MQSWTIIISSVGVLEILDNWGTSGRDSIPPLAMFLLSPNVLHMLPVAKSIRRSLRLTAGSLLLDPTSLSSLDEVSIEEDFICNSHYRITEMCGMTFLREWRDRTSANISFSFRRRRGFPCIMWCIPYSSNYGKERISLFLGTTNERVYIAR